MPCTRRAVLLTSLVTACLVCGCAAEQVARTPIVPSPLQQSVCYSDVSPHDLIPTQYRVMPGDVLELSIADIVAPGVITTKAVRVSERGTISLPSIGPVHVAGLTEDELNEAVRRAMRVLCL